MRTMTIQEEIVYYSTVLRAAFVAAFTKQKQKKPDFPAWLKEKAAISIKAKESGIYFDTEGTTLFINEELINVEEQLETHQTLTSFFWDIDDHITTELSTAVVTFRLVADGVYYVFECNFDGTNRQEINIPIEGL